MAFSDYVCIYIDSLGTFQHATNPKFIAKHTKCVAVEKTYIDTSYDFVADFIYDLNQGVETDKVMDIVIASDLKEIY